MYKNVLVISDNKFILEAIIKLVRSRDNYVNFVFAISPNSNLDDFKELGINQAINVKDELSIDIIIKKFDLIISAHCKQLFPLKLVSSLKCINIHPGYNPVNRGWYPQVFSILNNLPIGATIHEMDEELDHGPIIDRKLVDKYSWDSSLTLYNRILNAELELLDKNIDNIINGTYSVIKPEGNGNLFLKKDFNNLLHIDLEEKVTFRIAIDKLRALTHGEYKNAFFYDEHGNKVYINLVLSPA